MVTAEASNTEIGAQTQYHQTIISGNQGDGINTAAPFVVIQGCFVGVAIAHPDVTSSQSDGNHRRGIAVVGSAAYNVTIRGNHIGQNHGDGTARYIIILTQLFFPLIFPFFSTTFPVIMR